MQLTFGQYGSAVAVTPSDSTLISCRAIYVGTQAGGQALAINPAQTAGTSVSFAGPLAGTIYPFELNQGRIMATGTAVTNIVALT